MENDFFSLDQLPDADGLLSEETVYEEVDRYYDDLEDVVGIAPGAESWD